jgi:uncharacterized protein YjiS (DUF1127 family)
MRFIRVLADGARQLAWSCALRKAQAELNALDDRMLRDIGLDRSEIGSVLRDRGQERRRGVDLTAA